MLLEDLNIDCLEAILEYLKLEDLLNVSDTSKRLNHASKFVFVQKYGYGMLVINDQIRFSEQTIYISVSHTDKTKVIRPSRPKSILQILRCFGTFLNRIDIRSIRCYLTDIYIEYIDEFCSKSLSHLSLWIENRDLLNLFKNQFPKVKVVYLFTISLTQKNVLVCLFPKMQKLTLRTQCSEFIHSRCIANYFPCLEYFKMKEIEMFYHRKDYECAEVIKEFLKLNPQLKYFSLLCRDQSDINICQSFKEYGQNLERLRLIDIATFLHYFNGENIHLRNLKHLSIESEFKGPFINGIPFLCDHLETFEIVVDVSFYEHVLHFCQNNSSIRKLDICFLNSNSLLDFSSLVQSLPLLEELKIICKELTVDKIIQVLSLAKFLKFVSVDCICFEHFGCKNLQAHVIREKSKNFAIERTENMILFMKR